MTSPLTLAGLRGSFAIALFCALGGCVLTLEPIRETNGDGSPGASDGTMFTEVSAPDSAVDAGREGAAADAPFDGAVDVPAPSDVPLEASTDAAPGSDADGNFDGGSGGPDAVASDAGDATAADGAMADGPGTDGCVVSTETCNGRDDDCDGVADNNIAPIPCGVGACARLVPGCVGGIAPACVPGAPSPEVCNGVDDNCNGTADDGLGTSACGLGACAMRVNACTSGAPTACVPSPPSAAEFCNGMDDNCNGTIDEGCTCARFVLLGATGDGRTAATPTGSIQAAIASLAPLAVGTTAIVCVAAPAIGAGLCGPALYTEAVNMADRVSVLGGMNASTWSPTVGCTTTLQAPPGSAATVTFSHGVTNATQLDGFTILGPSAPGTSAVIGAVSITEGATVTNNVITAGSSPVSAGVRIVGVMGAAPSSPLVARNDIRGASGAATVQSFGVRVIASSPQLRENRVIAGGTGSNSAAAIELTDAPGAAITDNAQILGGTAPATFGVHATGATSGVVIARNQGINGGNGNAGSSALARGVSFESCTMATLPGTVFANRAIVGGATMNPTIGVDVGAGCTVVIDSNTSITGKSMGGADATGVRCSGTGASCVVRNNAAIVAFVGAGAAGSATGRAVLITGGAGGQVRDNRGVLGCSAGAMNCTGIVLDTTSGQPLVDGNELLANGGTVNAGISAHASAAVVSNNVVLVDGGSGIVLDNRAGVGFEVTVHSNTVVGIGASATRAESLFFVTNEGGAPVPSGVFRNNLGVCLTAGSGSARVAFRESGGNADPRLFENNDLFGCATLYFDADTASTLATIAAVNALADFPMPGPRNNVAVDPLFVSPTDFHLRGTSPVIDLGTGAGGPGFDYDLQPRFARRGFDIGADEVP